MIAVIGGSGAYDLLNKDLVLEKMNAGMETPYGKSVPIFKHNNPDFIFISRHGTSGYHLNASSVNYRANIYALKELGVKQIIAWSGPGAISENLKPGDYVLPDDILDETKTRKSSFYIGTGLGFVRQSPVFCENLKKVLIESLKGSDISISTLDEAKSHTNENRLVVESTYVCTEGPRLETPAEIKKYSLLGGHLVGMTLVPEVFLAKELEMCYTAICYITNYAEGMRPREFRAGELFEGLLDKTEKEKVEKAVKGFPDLIKNWVQKISENKSECECSKLMERFRKSGRISENWHTWLGKD